MPFPLVLPATPVVIWAVSAGISVLTSVFTSVVVGRRIGDRLRDDVKTEVAAGFSSLAEQMAPLMAAGFGRPPVPPPEAGPAKKGRKAKTEQPEAEPAAADGQAA